ncbi:MAG: acetyl-CoA carboxylase biotin carboxylase subunit [Hydrogenoanaerobacterium sp.]
MFKKVLIANRGEIAVRIIRACRELGIRTVAVCSEADKMALHAQIADETVCIGAAASSDSYLNMQAVLGACETTGADALHPGFGFLSENSGFARLCERCGVKFIGPSASSIERMGDKANAKTTMKNAGVPVVPGSDGAITSMAQAKSIAKEVGYPVMVKASAGGGGRGIRRVEEEAGLQSAITAAQQESLNFFGDDTIYLEKFIVNPRHIEIQIMGDEHGNIVHLGERDCSLQRRNQKMIEESPSPSPLMTGSLRSKMGAAAIKAAKAVGYYNAGTVEFLLDATGSFYFMEMNTRVQVEHPVTEFVTNTDIVQEQIKIAAGLELSFKQSDITMRGHAIECRINAENPAFNFRPSPGTVTALHIPGGPGIRVDSAMYAGYTIPPYYDAMIAKLIAYAPTRKQALAKMHWALAEFLVEGVDTNIDFQLELLRDEEVINGSFDIGYIERRQSTGLHK